MKTKYLWLTFCAAFVATVSLRLYQLFFWVDSQGIYTDDGLLSWVLIGILFAAAAVLIGGSISSKRLPKRYDQQRNIPAGVFHIGLGAAAIIYSVLEIMRLATPNGRNGAPAGSLLYVAVILAFAGVGAGVVWLAIGVSYFIKRNLIRWIPTAGILPPIWLAIMLFTQSVQLSGNTVAMNNTEGFYDTMTLILMTLFSFNQCKMIAGAQGKKCGKRVYGYGLSMILFGVTSILPAFVSLTGLIQNTGSFGLVFSIAIGLLCLSAGLFLLLLPLGEKAYEEELAEEAAEPETGEAEEEEKPETPQGSWFVRAMMAFLRGMAALKKFFTPKHKRRKVIPWNPGELDEKPTKRLDETWRLDFYGFDNGDDRPYYPKVYDITPEEEALAEKRKQQVGEVIKEAQNDSNSEKSRKK